MYIQHSRDDGPDLLISSFKLNSLTVGLVLLAVYLRATRIVVLSVDWN
jgi:hypothetical protein